jgi:pilus assembly protein Flp/PilA
VAKLQEAAMLISDVLRSKGHHVVSLLALRRLIENEEGVTAIEYGLFAALIAVAAVVVMGTVGTNLSLTFSKVAASL